MEKNIELLKKFISSKDKTPLNLTTDIQVDDTSIKPDYMTLGMVAEELRKHHYFVKVNSRSGSLPSNTMLQTQLSRILPYAQPGTPAFTKAMKLNANLNDLEFEGEEFNMQAPQGGGMPEEMPKPTGTETDRMTINPRVKEQQPIM
jgi:hypothetical protein